MVGQAHREGDQVVIWNVHCIIGAEKPEGATHNYKARLVSGGRAIATHQRSAATSAIRIALGITAAMNYDATAGDAEAAYLQT